MTQTERQEEERNRRGGWDARIGRAAGTMVKSSIVGRAVDTMVNSSKETRLPSLAATGGGGLYGAGLALAGSLPPVPSSPGFVGWNQGLRLLEPGDDYGSFFDEDVAGALSGRSDFAALSVEPCPCGAEDAGSSSLAGAASEAAARYGARTCRPDEPPLHPRRGRSHAHAPHRLACGRSGVQSAPSSATATMPPTRMDLSP